MFIPVHPHYYRSWQLPDGSIVYADSYDDTVFDKDERMSVTTNHDAPTITDYVKSGELSELATINGSPEVTMLSAAEFAAKFVDIFNAAGFVPDIKSDVPPVEPVNPVEPVEPSK